MLQCTICKKRDAVDILLGFPICDHKICKVLLLHEAVEVLKKK